MHVEHIKLKNFRNYHHLDLDFNKNLNIIFGNNAQGKTNIVEAIYYCATARSHRSNSDKDLIMWDEQESHIQLDLMKNSRKERIDIHLRKNNKKGIAINRYPINKLNELYGTLNVILFSPEDLSLIKKGPSERRRFIDIELSQIDKIYLYNLQQYHKILKQRNNFLKSIHQLDGHVEMLDIWDEQLVAYGIKLMKSRHDFIQEIMTYVAPIHEQITNHNEDLILGYEKNTNEEYFYDNLKKHRQRDIKLGNTSVGPHRDDLVFSVNDVDLRTYGSQGQHRTAALSLKLAEIEIIKAKTRENPVLLLDDVLSELDDSRQKHLMETLHELQTIITCTGVEDFIRKGLTANGLIKVNQGKVEIVK